jgi:peptide/nickel transport system ATP-binding protein
MSVVAGLADEVMVMYGGFVAEQGDALQVFEHPAHPYTHGLLASIPDSASDPDAPLVGIPGQPPDMRTIPEGCVFRARCPHAFARCVERPLLSEIDAGHHAACWLGPEVRLAERTGHGTA